MKKMFLYFLMSVLTIYLFINIIIVWIYSLIDLIIFNLIPLLYCVCLVISDAKKNKKSILGKLMLLYIIKIMITLVHFLSFISCLTFPIIMFLSLFAFIIQIPLGLLNMIIMQITQRYLFINTKAILINYSLSDIIIYNMKNVLGEHILYIIDEIGKYLHKIDKKNYRFSNEKQIYDRIYEKIIFYKNTINNNLCLYILNEKGIYNI